MQAAGEAPHGTPRPCRTRGYSAVGIRGPAQAGVRPSRIAASRAASMLPPETMHTILPSPARPESAAATARAPAPSAITRARSASVRTAAGGLVERQRDATGEQRVGSIPHRAEQHLAARAVDERRRVVDLDRSAGRERGGERRARLGLAGEHARRGAHRRERARDPGREAAAAPRARARCRSRRDPRPARGRSCRCRPSRRRRARGGRSSPSTPG